MSDANNIIFAWDVNLQFAVSPEDAPAFFAGLEKAVMEYAAAQQVAVTGAASWRRWTLESNILVPLQRAHDEMEMAVRAYWLARNLGVDADDYLPSELEVMFLDQLVGDEEEVDWEYPEGEPGDDHE
jgi:hypothetical protein